LSKSDLADIKKDGRDVTRIKKMFYIFRNADPNERDDGIGLGEQMVIQEYALEKKLTNKQEKWFDGHFKYYAKHPLVKPKKETSK